MIENNDITDKVPDEISASNGLDYYIPDIYNAREILFNNIDLRRVTKTDIYYSLGEMK